MNRLELYDFLCDLLDRYMEQTNLCNIREENGKMVCDVDLEGCCEGCAHLGENGCTTSCLGCKLYVCYKKQQEDPVFRTLVRSIKDVAKAYDLIFMRTAREDALYIG